jgi:hypothetical protein
MIFQERPFEMTRSGLGALARNCPNLLRVTKKILQFGYNPSLLILKRMNGTSEFRRVRKPPSLRMADNVDYDSMESCSDDDETKIPYYISTCGGGLCVAKLTSISNVSTNFELIFPNF